MTEYTANKCRRSSKDGRQMAGLVVSWYLWVVFLEVKCRLQQDVDFYRLRVFSHLFSFSSSLFTAIITTLAADFLSHSDGQS